MARGAAMRKTLAALVALTPSILFAQTFGEPLTGETVPVNTQFGIQTDPHVSGNVVAYTNEEPSSEIRYFNLATHADAAIPKSAADFDFLSDVSGQTLVFTRVTSDRSAIYAFDVTTAGSPGRARLPRPVRAVAAPRSVAAPSPGRTSASPRPRQPPRWWPSIARPGSPAGSRTTRSSTRTRR